MAAQLVNDNEDSGSRITDIKISPEHLEELEESASSEEQLTLWQAVRKWPKVTAYCLALTSAILLWGYGKIHSYLKQD
jgi:hypothetical protein